jgi:hypothetical protein
METRHVAVPPSDPPPDSGPPSSPATSAAVGHPAACPKCGRKWYYSCDVDGDLACFYCGWIKYQRPAADPEIPKPPERRCWACAAQGRDGFAAYASLCGMHDHRKRRHGDPLWEPPGKGA